MTNSAETDRGVSSPRVISIPGSHLDIETRRIRAEILENRATTLGDMDDYYELADLIDKLAKLEDW